MNCMIILKRMLCLCLLFLAVNTAMCQNNSLNTFSINSTAELKDFFKYTTDRRPLLALHRGGPSIGYPENCTATFERVLGRVHAILEIDPRLTKDGEVVVFHDATINRTTTGTGNLNDYTLSELQQNFYLTDIDKNPTQYRIQTLDEIIKWAKGKTILMLDKKDVPADRIIEIIEANNAESYVLLSTYSLEETQYYYNRNPNLMFEAFILNIADYNAYNASNIPWSNIVAYVSESTNTTLYNNLHNKGVMTIFYTAKTLEEETDIPIRIQSYKNVINNYGVDIILTERPVEAYAAVQTLWPATSSKSQYFVDKFEYPNTETVTDIDGNVYNTVRIGNQIWTTTNFKATRLNDGTAIAKPADNTAWSSMTTAAYSTYSALDAGEISETAVAAKYGLLYNGYAAKDTKLAPLGWRVPSDDDFKVLELYIGMATADVNGSDWRGLLSPRLKSTDLWTFHEKKGGWDDFGLALHPGGQRAANGTFSLLKERGYYWTATPKNATTTQRRAFAYSTAGIHNAAIDNKIGYSMRLVKEVSVTSVSLGSYSVVKQNNIALIRWNTVSEQNNSFFEVQRSTDGLNYQTLKIVAGVGTTNLPQYYRYTDDTPFNGVNYYRIKQVDLNGNYTYLGVRAVTFRLADKSFVVYPNPSVGRLYIRLLVATEEKINVRLIDIAGRIVHQESIPANKLQADYQLNLVGTPTKGLYILEIKGKNISEKTKITIL